MGWFHTPDIEDPDIAVRSNEGKAFKIIQLVSVLMLAGAAIFLVLEGFTVIAIDFMAGGFTINGLVISIGILGVGGMTVLPWVRIFERLKSDKRFKITSIVFMAVIGVVVLLWLICVWQLVALLNSIISAVEELGEAEANNIITQTVNTVQTIRVSMIISLQFMVLSSIAMYAVKYRKSMIVYQVMNGIAFLYVDFFFSLILTVFNFSYSATEGFDFSIAGTADLLTQPLTYALLFIAIILMGIASMVFRRTEKRRIVATANAAAEAVDAANKPAPDAPAETGESVDEKLRKIQSLYDSGLISQEEYETKRAEILSSL